MRHQVTGGPAVGQSYPAQAQRLTTTRCCQRFFTWDRDRIGSVTPPFGTFSAPQSTSSKRNLAYTDGRTNGHAGNRAGRRGSPQPRGAWRPSGRTAGAGRDKRHTPPGRRRAGSHHRTPRGADPKSSTRTRETFIITPNATTGPDDSKCDQLRSDGHR